MHELPNDWIWQMQQVEQKVAKFIHRRQARGIVITVANEDTINQNAPLSESRDPHVGSTRRENAPEATRVSSVMMTRRVRICSSS